MPDLPTCQSTPFSRVCICSAWYLNATTQRGDLLVTPSACPLGERVDLHDHAVGLVRQRRTDACERFDAGDHLVDRSTRWVWSLMGNPHSAILCVSS